MFNVLTFIFENYDAIEDCPEPEKLSSELMSAGFDYNEVGDALAWIRELLMLLEEVEIFDESYSMRSYWPIETDLISTEVRGFLYALENSKAITPNDRELIIDRLLVLPAGDANLEIAKLITLLVLWVQNTELPEFLLEELLNMASDSSTMH